MKPVKNRAMFKNKDQQCNGFQIDDEKQGNHNGTIFPVLCIHIILALNFHGLQGKAWMHPPTYWK